MKFLKKFFALPIQLLLLFWVKAQLFGLDFASSFTIGAPTGLPVRPVSAGPPETLIGNIINFAITILITIGIAASIIWLLYGAVKYITSGGDKAAIESAKTHIVSAIVGLIILVFTFVIINLVLSIFGAGTLSGTTFRIPPI